MLLFYFFLKLNCLKRFFRFWVFFARATFILLLCWLKLNVYQVYQLKKVPCVPAIPSVCPSVCECNARCHKPLRVCGCSLTSLTRSQYMFWPIFIDARNPLPPMQSLLCQNSMVKLSRISFRVLQINLLDLRRRFVAKNLTRRATILTECFKTLAFICLVRFMIIFTTND